MFSSKALRNINLNSKNNNQMKKYFCQFSNNKINKILNKDNNQLYLGILKNQIIHKKNNFNFSTKFNNKDDILPDHLFYDIPKYSKNPENVDFPWLIGGAPFLELKVYCKENINCKKLL